MAEIGIKRNITMTRNVLVAPLKMFYPGALLKNPDLGIDKKL